MAAVETAVPFAQLATVDARPSERMNWTDPSVQSLDQFLAESTAATHDRDFVPASGDSGRSQSRSLDGRPRQRAGRMPERSGKARRPTLAAGYPASVGVAPAARASWRAVTRVAESVSPRSSQKWVPPSPWSRT